MNRLTLSPWSTIALTCVTVCLTACADTEDVATTQMPLVVDASGLTQCTTNLGYTVTLTEAQLMIEDVELMVGGEPHMLSWVERVSELLVPTAYAHPEHMLGGEVAGGLQARVMVDWLRAHGAELGVLDLQVDRFASANFRFARATAVDSVGNDEPLFGHTALLAGTATRDGRATAFTILIDSPLDRRLVGAPFQVDVLHDDPRSIGFQLLTVDPSEGDTLFDDVDFAALDARDDQPMALHEATDDVAVRDAYYAVRRSFQTHDHFRFDVLR